MSLFDKEADPCAETPMAGNAFSGALLYNAVEGDRLPGHTCNRRVAEVMWTRYRYPGSCKNLF